MPDNLLIDPLGREIMFHDHPWLEHVLPFKADMAVFRNRAERAVRTPMVICYSSSAGQARLYYDAPDDRGRMICVVVDLFLHIVKTAYRSNKIKAGGFEWTAPTPPPPARTPSRDS